MKKYIVDLEGMLKQLVKYVKKGEMSVEDITVEPHFQTRNLNDNLEETERKNKIEYYEYTITIRQMNKTK